jgi:hypothetical protein
MILSINPLIRVPVPKGGSFRISTCDLSILQDGPAEDGAAGKCGAETVNCQRRQYHKQERRRPEVPA